MVSPFKINDTVLSVEQIVGATNIKYNVLVPIVNEAFNECNKDQLNVYIDLASVFKSLFGNNIRVELKEYLTLSTNIINIAAHYRRFFLTRYKSYANIYFVYSNTNYVGNRAFVPTYSEEITKARQGNLPILKHLNNSIDMIKVVIPYIPNVHFIETDFEAGVGIYNLMCLTDINDEKAHVVISKDTLIYQLVAMKPDTIIIRPKRNDSSYYIDKRNLYSVFLKERKSKIDPASCIISPELYTTILALNTIKEKNITTMLNINHAFRIIQNAILNNKILNNYNRDLDYLWRNLMEEKVPANFKGNPVLFSNRFKALDFAVQHQIFMNTAEVELVKLSLVDKYDPEGLKELNNKYFITLDLNNL